MGKLLTQDQILVLHREMFAQYEENVRRYYSSSEYNKSKGGCESAYYSFLDWLLIEYDALLRKLGEKIIGEKDKNDALTVSYMMGWESANDPRIVEIKPKKPKKPNPMRMRDMIAFLEAENSELRAELEKWKEGEYRP